MDDEYTPSFFQALRYAGPCNQLTAVGALLLTGWLIALRIRRWRRGGRADPVVELACLFGGPVGAVLVAIPECIMAVQRYVEGQMNPAGDLDADHPLLHGLQATALMCTLVWWMLMLGLLALLLPKGARRKIDYPETANPL